MSHQGLQMLFTQDIRKNLSQEEYNSNIKKQISIEVSSISKSMQYLPTVKEVEALPDLTFLLEISQHLLEQNSFFDLNLESDHVYRNYLIEELFSFVCYSITKTKIYNEKRIIKTADALFVNLVDWATRHLKEQNVFILKLLNVIINNQSEYYKTNGKDSLQNQPFGEPFLFQEQQQTWVKELQKGDKIDYIRKTPDGQNIWIPAEVCENFAHSGRLEVKYLYDNHLYFVYGLIGVRKFGEKKSSYQWREQLKLKDRVLYHFNSIWSEFEIVTIEENGQIEISEVIDGQVEDQVIETDIYSENMAQKGTVQKVWSQEDSDDELYLECVNEKKYAILRHLNSYSNSVFLVKYINKFGEKKGFDFVLDVINQEIEVSQDVLNLLINLVRQSLDNLVRPFIQKHGEKILKFITDYVLNNDLENLRSIDKHNLSNFLETIQNLCERFKNTKDGKEYYFMVEFKLAMICIESNILDKQFFGVKILSNMEKRMRNFDQDSIKTQIAAEFKQKRIFSIIIKGHHSLISKSQSVMKILFSEDQVSDSELNDFWDQIVKSDLETKNSLLALLKEVILNFSLNQVLFFLDKMCEKARQINNLELVQLLYTIKKMGQNKFENQDVVNKANEVIWAILQCEQEIKKEFLKEVISQFTRCIDENNADQYINKIVINIIQKYNTLRNIKLLKILMKQDSELSVKIFRSVESNKLINNFVKEIEELVKSKNRQNEDRQIKSKNEFNTQEKLYVRKKLQLINALQKLKESENLISFDNYQKIWKATLRTDFQDNILIDWLKEFIAKRKIVNHEKYQQFFNEYIDEFLQSKRSDLFIILILVFYKINLQQGKILSKEIKLEAQGYYQYNTKTKQIKILISPIDNLFGYEKIWNIFLNNDNKEQEKQICSLLTKLIEYPEIKDNDIDSNLYEQEKNQIFNKFKEMMMGEDLRIAKKGLIALQTMMQREEQYGFGNLFSFDSLRQLSKQGIMFEKNHNYMNNDKHTILMKKNKTLADLRLLISKEYSMLFESINLQSNGDNDYSHMYNSKTLEDLNIKQFNQFQVNEYELPVNENEFVLLNEEQTDFNDSVMQIFKEIFDNYSTNGNMNREQLAKFTTKATDNIHCGENDDRIQSVFREYANGELFLKFEQFLNFYRDCALQGTHKQRTVQNNLSSLGYDSSLRLKNFQKSEQFFKQMKQSLRFKLASDKEFNEILIQKFLKENSDKDIYSAVKFMTPNFDLILEILQEPLKFIQKECSQSEWEYQLVIMEALLFSKKKILKILEFNNTTITDLQFNNFVQKIFNQSFISSLLRKIDKIDVKNVTLSQVYHTPFHILDAVFRVSTDFMINNYISDTKNFLIYSMKIKKKKKEEQNNQGTQVSTAPTVPTQEEMSDNKLVHRDDSKLSYQEKNLQNIKNILIDNNFDVQNFTDSLPLKKIVELTLTILDHSLDNIDEQKGVMKEFIIFNVLTLLSALNFQKELLKQLLQEERSKFKNLIFKGLTHEKTIIRIIFKNFYLFLTANVNDFELKQSFLSVIINNIHVSDNNDEMHQLIELATNLLKEISEITQNSNCEKIQSSFDFKKIFNDFSKKLLSYETKEINFDSKEDNTLSAILTFMQKLLQSDKNIIAEMESNQKNELLIFLFKNCLFNVSSEKIELDNLICKSVGSRSNAMKLITTMTKDDTKSVILLLLKGFSPLSKYLPDFQNKQYFDSNSKKNNHGFIGIRNPGCICYMNAMLQQFFFIPTFRYGVLLADDKQPEDIVEVFPHHKIDDNIFHQFQKMFAYLDISKRQDFNPRDFCASYKDVTNQRVNVMIQQDAQEFLNVIFDKLEKSLKGSPFQGILDSVFRGKTKTVFECQNCKFTRFKQEIFYNLSLEVKNLENIEESFLKFIQNETISDFTCDSCKKKCDVTKQTFLSELPNQLIIHLQKIVFDLDLLTNIKIASKFSFPQVLDLQAFMHEDNQQKENEKDDQEFQYKLVGVVVHRGNANFGHYTSLINVNRNDPNRPERNVDEWMEFDDSKIYPFNMKNFEDECFGTKIKSDFAQNYFGVETNISKSAYILIYDKVQKNDLKLVFNENNIDEYEKVVNVVKDKQFTFDDNVLKTGFYNIQPYIPENYRQIINEDNISMILENLLFSGYFTNFFSELITNSTLPLVSIDMPNPISQLTQYQQSLCDLILNIVPNYFFQIYCVTYQNIQIKKIVSIIETALIYRQEKVYEFFEKNVYNQYYFIKDIFENNSDYSVHVGISQFLSFTLTLLVRNYKVTNQQDNSQKSQQQLKVENQFYQFLDGLRQFSPLEQNEIKINKKMLSYFQIIKNICALNPVVAYYFLNQNYLNKLYDLYMRTDFMTSRNNEKIMNSIISFIEVLLQQIKNKMSDDYGTPNYQLVQSYFHKFATINLLQKIIEEDYKFNKYQILKNLIQLICTDNLTMQKQLIKFALKGIKQCLDNQQIIGYFECLQAILSINEEYKFEKIQMIFGIPKLIELKVEKDEQILYLYGLGKESSINRNVFKYPSTINLEKSLIDLLLSLKEQNETQAIFTLHYILLFACQHREIRKYLLTLPSSNYMGKNLLDWIHNFISYQLNVLPNSFNPPRQDVYYTFMKPAEQLLKDYQSLISKLLQEDYNYTIEQSNNFVLFQQQEELQLLINSINKTYIIGKTLKCNQIFRKNINTEEDEIFISGFVNKVSLMEYESDGYINSQIPKNALSFNMYLIKKELEPEIEEFLNTSYNNVVYDEDEEYKQLLKPIGYSDNEEDEENQQQKPKVKKIVNNELKIEKQEVNLDDNFIEVNYVFRIALKNNSDSHFYVDIKIEGDENNHYCGNYNIFLKNGKGETLVCNLHSLNLKNQFEGLKIKVRVHKFPTIIDKYFYEFDNENDMDYQLVYEHKFDA